MSYLIFHRPLEEHVSRWMYDVIATDKHGASVSDTLEIHVQHHRGYRSVTHEISMHLQMESLGMFSYHIIGISHREMKVKYGVAVEPSSRCASFSGTLC